MHHALIFEPWTLGDVVVAACVARQLKLHYEISIVAAPEWEKWLQTLGLFAFVIPFHIPWTDQKKKYDFGRYRISRFLELRRGIRQITPDVILDLRGDPRNVVFLKILNVAPVVSLWRQRPVNVYERVNVIMNLIEKDAAGSNVAPFEVIRTKSSRITCFFGASWGNRQVPRDQALCILKGLSAICPVNLLLQPSESAELWNNQNIDGLCVLQLSVIDAAEIIKESRVCVCTDSGWIHMAYFYGVPRVALLGFDTSQEWMPPETRIIFSNPYFPAKVRYRARYRDSIPLANISVPAVIRVVQELLAQS